MVKTYIPEERDLDALEEARKHIAALSEENRRLREKLSAYEHHFHVLHPDAIEGILRQIARKALEVSDG